MIQRYTLDTNCIVAIDEQRPDATPIRAIADAHAAGKAHVAVVGIAASENPKTGGYIQTFNQFLDRLSKLNLSHLEILKPMGYFGITFFDWCLWTDKPMQDTELRIHEVLFPTINFYWQDYCQTNDLDSRVIDRKWRNCKCDVQAMWAHLNGARDVFVTSDRNFHTVSKKAALVSLGAKRIEYPEIAASLI